MARLLATITLENANGRFALMMHSIQECTRRFLPRQIHDAHTWNGNDGETYYCEGGPANADEKGRLVDA